MKTEFCIGLCFICFLSACKNKNLDKTTLPVKESLVNTYTEQYRPQYHFSPREKWMNDPNGLVYNDGVYHLFYQYYPEDIVWGPMHWGHAVSRDMVSWEHRPIALFPDENGYIFSGSAVVDKENTSGFGTGETAPLVAIFTYHNMEGEKAGNLDYQTQGIAYSLDNGDSWVKYAKNPVISNPGIKDFRDPKVFWHQESKRWVLVLVAGDHALIYNSTNLKDWELRSSFGKEVGAHGGVWECPDLFPLEIGKTGEKKWVLLISINPGAPNGGSGTQYFVGDFDGTTFTSEQKEVKWIDWGADNYAGVTYNNTPSDERIFIGWMSNWAYAKDTPTKRWRSAMTLPRNLFLEKVDESFTLFNYPLETLNSLRKPMFSKDVSISPKEEEVISFANFNQSEILFETSGRNFEMVFYNDLGDEQKFLFNQEKAEMLLDRKSSGQTAFKDAFADKIHRMPLAGIPSGEIEIRILMDWSSVEIFVNRGQKVMTSQIFPKESYNGLRIKNTGNELLQLQSLTINAMKSIWH